MFVPLLRPSRYKGAWGGRGSGKSHFFAEMLIERHLLKPGLRSLCGREVQRSLKDSVKRLLSDKIRAMGVEREFDEQVAEIRAPGGGVISFTGLQDHTVESVKSYEGYDIAWLEEAQSISERSLELIRPTIRAPGSELWFSWNPRHAEDAVDQLLRGPTAPVGSVVIRANWSDNPFFPAELEDERKHDLEHNRHRYGHIWEGEYEPAAIGALWDRGALHRSRTRTAPDLRRVVVAVDPAASVGSGANETGVVVCGEGDDGRGYVLADLSLMGRPDEWAKRAVAAYDRFEADAVVIERNQGGDMVAHTLRTVRPNLPIIEVHASRGKHVRAEPIAALYALGQISHVGTFPELEDQMCLTTPAGYQGPGSPDRLDALVWGLTQLFPAITTPRSSPEQIERTRKRLKKRRLAGMDPMGF